MEEKLTQFSTNMDALTEQEQKQLIALINKGNKPLKKRKERWKAKHYETYYFADETTCGVTYYTQLDGTLFADSLYKFGNYFKTAEEAEFELNKRLVYQELKDYALEHNEMSFNWKNSSQRKWVIFYDNQSKRLDYDYWYTHYYIGQIYFYSKETAQEAVKTVGEDRIRKYLFDVN